MVFGLMISAQILRVHPMLERFPAPEFTRKLVYQHPHEGVDPSAAVRRYRLVVDTRVANKKVVLVARNVGHGANSLFNMTILAFDRSPLQSQCGQIVGILQRVTNSKILRLRRNIIGESGSETFRLPKPRNLTTDLII